MDFKVVYLSEARVRLFEGKGKPRTVESEYGETVRRRILRSQEKHAWKSQGGDGGPLSGPAIWGSSMPGPNSVQIDVSSVCSGGGADSFYYTLEGDGLCAIVSSERGGEEERRVWNDHTKRLRFLSHSREDGHLAFSFEHPNWVANIGVRLADESGLMELTEGDSGWENATCLPVCRDRA